MDTNVWGQSRNSRNKGNLITGKLTGSGAVSATWTLAYDAENRLLTANKSDATVAAAYDYDPLGRRIHKSGTGVTNTWFLNDGDDEVVEYNSNKDVVALYVPGPAIDEPIAMVTPNGNGTYSRKYFHTNHQGSVIAMSDDAGARVEGPFIYGPYGNCFQGTTPCAQLASSVPYKFTSRRLDPETELYYYRARMYWGTGGRFLQTDPVGYTADLNLYTYVGNDPTDKTDPTGECPWCLAMAVGAGSGAAIDVGLQLYENGGDINNISGREVLTAAALGGGLSLFGPTGGLLGRGGTRAAEYGFGKSAGLLNGGINKGKQLRVGWGWSEKKAASVLRAAGKWVEELTGKAHVDVPGVAVKGAANPVRDGLVSGAAGAAGAHEAQPQSSSTSSASSNPPRGSGWSALAGQTVRAQGTRICPTDSSGERSNSC